MEDLRLKRQHCFFKVSLRAIRWLEGVLVPFAPSQLAKDSESIFHFSFEDYSLYIPAFLSRHEYIQ